MAEQKFEDKKIRKEEKARIQQVDELIKEWVKDRAGEASIHFKWVDLKYEKDETKTANLNDNYSLKHEVSDLLYSQKVTKLPQDTRNRKKLETKAVNHEKTAADQKLAFTSAVMQQTTHTITVGLDLTFGISANAGFFSASLETTLSLSSAHAVTEEKRFEFNPETSIRVAGQHEAHIIAYLYPMPEIHPFEIDVTVKGHVPIYFKEKVNYDPGTHTFTHHTFGGKHLYFIPIQHIFQDLENKPRNASNSDFTIKENGSIVFKVKGETKVTNYVTEIDILEQTPLPGVTLVQPPLPEAVQSSTDITYATKRVFVGIDSGSGITFEEVTKFTKNVDHLCKAIDHLSKGMKEIFSATRSEDLKSALEKTKETYLEDLKETHRQEIEMAKAGAKHIKSKNDFKGMKIRMFDKSTLEGLAAEEPEEPKQENTTNAAASTTTTTSTTSLSSSPGK